MPAIKISESTAKQQNPGDKDVVRVYADRGRATADVLSVAGETLDLGRLNLHHHTQHSVRRTLTGPQISGTEPLLETVYVEGARPLGNPTFDEIRRRREADLDLLDPGVRRLVNPHTYHVSLTTELWDLKQRLITEARNGNGG